MKSPYKLKVAIYGFKCPVTRVRVRKGETYVEREGIALSCRAGLPARRLRPLRRTA